MRKILSFYCYFLSPILFFFFNYRYFIINFLILLVWCLNWIRIESLILHPPNLFKKKNFCLSEAALKYFLIQALASTVIIISSCLIFFSLKIPSFLLLISLFTKLGAAPFHFWFPQVIEGLSWLQAIILITIQKLAPIYLISYLIDKTLFLHFTTISAILSSLVGALGGLNTIRLRKLIAFSSINHISWILIAISINEILWSLYIFFLFNYLCFSGNDLFFSGIFYLRPFKF